MKLKTKFQDEDFGLGEVVEANIYYGGSGRIKVIADPAKGGIITFYFESLKGLNEMFEDYEEPTTYYYISDFGAIREGDVGKFVEDEIVRKEIGNYFATKEEAEKAVEKLKAWKRLKDKGFRFMCWNDDYTIDFTINGQKTEPFKLDNLSIDLFTLFGGEE